jgi:hypothetical protein
MCVCACIRCCTMLRCNILCMLVADGEECVPKWTLLCATYFALHCLRGRAVCEMHWLVQGSKHKDHARRLPAKAAPTSVFNVDLYYACTKTHFVQYTQALHVAGNCSHWLGPLSLLGLLRRKANVHQQLRASTSGQINGLSMCSGLPRHENGRGCAKLAPRPCAQCSGDDSRDVAPES